MVKTIICIFTARKKYQYQKTPCTLSLLPKTQSTLTLPQERVQVFIFLKKIEFLSHKIKLKETVLFKLFFQINTSQSLRSINFDEIAFLNPYSSWKFYLCLLISYYANFQPNLDQYFE